MNSYPDASMLLAVEAYRQAPTLQARSEVLRTQSRSIIARFTGHTGRIHALALSPDGRILASASADHTVRLWDITHRSLRNIFEGHTNAVNTLAFSPDGSILASGSSDGTIALSRSGDQTRVGQLAAGAGAVNTVVFSPDGRILASGYADGAVRLWDTARHTALVALPGHDAINSLSFGADGRTLASGSDNGKIVIWNVASRRINSTLQVSPDYFGPRGVQSLAYDSVSQRLASVNGNVTFWDTAHSVLLSSSRTVEAVGISMTLDGQTMLTSNGSLDIWDVASRTLRASMPDPAGQATALTLGSNGHTAATGYDDGNVVLWDVSLPPSTTGDRYVDPLGRYAGILSQDASLLAQVDRDPEAGIENVAVKVWSMPAHRGIAQLTVRPPTAGAFTSDGKLLALAASGRHTTIWSVASQQAIAMLGDEMDGINELAFSPDGVILAGAGADGTVRLWNTTAPSRTVRLEGISGAVNSISFSPDGHELAAGGGDGTIAIWDLASHHLLARLTEAHGPVNGIAYSKDGRRIAGAYADGNVQLWDAKGRRLITTLAGSGSAATAVAFSPDGRTVAIARNDYVVELWDSSDRTAVAILTPGAGETSLLGGATAPNADLSGGVAALAFQADGHLVTTFGSTEGHLTNVWDLDVRHSITRVCNLMKNDLAPDQWGQLLPDLQPHPICP